MKKAEYDNALMWRIKMLYLESLSKMRVRGQSIKCFGVARPYSFDDVKRNIENLPKNLIIDFTQSFDADEDLSYSPMQTEVARSPKAKDMIKNFAGSMSRWARAGLPVVTKEQFDERFDKCKNCEHWNGSALLGTGRCKLCGCSTKAKLHLATEKCPIDKWGPIEKTKD